MQIPRTVDILHTGGRDPQTQAILGAAHEVHKALGPGFLEYAYHEALAIELSARGIPFRREVSVEIQYKGRTLPTRYRADFLCDGDIVLEIKAIRGLSDLERAQTLHYLRASGKTRALLINFAARRLEWDRLVWSYIEPAEPAGAKA